MQLFQQVQKSFHLMGFSPKLEPFNRTILNILVPSFLAVIFMWIFLFNNSDALENIESIHNVTVSTSVFVSFAGTIFISKKLFSFIESLNESK